ncbi:HNH endonuclease signature motif containing protein [Burkholderia cenocepacia]|uniref:HNH endonuclease n=1 Tax=Burkholderia cenocepacia TaxID=95486 RepID=UPI0024B80B58|nr:HNH endonuclease signature motif containing protein [Burkholderia cenocepacia]MDI9695313.1 HNH endonuclease signature motif containing protein [Burkholderia cenocepacia]
MATYLTLHDEIGEVLMTAGGPLPARMIADEVNRRGRYARRDGAPVDANQITARSLNYPHLFTVADGLIALHAPSSAARTKGKSIVRDYRALGQFFRRLNGDLVTLHFTDIEEILNAPLPPVARRNDTFWQNSDPFLPKNDGHKWAHEWMKAGWRKSSVDRGKETIVFQRVGEPTPLSVLDAIEPFRHDLIYDLLQRVPISVDAWRTTTSGGPVKNIKANPRFCYNWSFGSPEEGYAVCFWHENLHASASGEVFADTNYRAGADDRRRRAVALTSTARERSRLIAQAERAEAMDQAIKNTFRLQRPLHVIICSRGEDRHGTTSDLPNSTASVKFRELDSLTWSVEAYDDSTGACRIVRESRAALDSSAMVGDSVGSDERVARYMSVEVRQEQAAFRKAVFEAYDRRCAVSGCDIPEVLEAAHLRGRNWRAGHNAATDGILLRRDLHTLYDRQLLELYDGVARFSPLVAHHYANLEGASVTVRHDPIDNDFSNGQASDQSIHQKISRQQ